MQVGCLHDARLSTVDGDVELAAIREDLLGIRILHLAILHGGHVAWWPYCMVAMLHGGHVAWWSLLMVAHVAWWS